MWRLGRCTIPRRRRSRVRPRNAVGSLQAVQRRVFIAPGHVRFRCLLPAVLSERSRRQRARTSSGTPPWTRSRTLSRNGAGPWDSATVRLSLAVSPHAVPAPAGSSSRAMAWNACSAACRSSTISAASTLGLEQVFAVFERAAPEPTGGPGSACRASPIRRTRTLSSLPSFPSFSALHVGSLCGVRPAGSSRRSRPGPHAGAASP